MDLVDDAMELVRNKDNPKEVAYANYANALKGMANEARKESRSIQPTPVSKEAKQTYAKEVEDLNNKLNTALANAPKERQAQTLANKISSIKIQDNPGMDYEHRQREKARALTEARAIVGAKKIPVVITDKEWEAIQANAISTNTLTKILLNTDQDKFKQRATPRNTGSLSKNQITYIKILWNTGMYSQAEIADIIGVSKGTISSAINNMSK